LKNEGVSRLTCKRNSRKNLFQGPTKNLGEWRRDQREEAMIGQDVDKGREQTPERQAPGSSNV
jgi:hypothetical protein